MKDLVKQRRFSEALQLFHSAGERDAISYDMALNTCAKGLLHKQVWEIWDEMPAHWKTTVSYTTMIQLCGRVRDIRRAEQFWQELHDAGMKPNAITYNAMISAYGMVGASSRSVEVFEEARRSLPQLDLCDSHMLYLAAMSAVARQGDYAKTRELFTAMLEDGLAPTNFHVNALITSCARAPDPGTAQAIFDMMPRWNLTPRMEEYSILLSCHRNNLARCQEILSAARQAHLEPGALMQEQLLEAHVLAGDRPGAQALIGGGIFDRSSLKVQRLIRDADDLPLE